MLICLDELSLDFIALLMLVWLNVIRPPWGFNDLSDF